MPIFLDPRGHATYGIGICGRCSRKMFLEDLFSDPNSPGLMVCAKDLDVLDPWRLPARQTEQITLPFYRPDLPLDQLDVPAYLDLRNGELAAEGNSPFEGQVITTEDGQPLLVEGEVPDALP